MAMIKVTSEDLQSASGTLMQGSNEISDRLTSMKNLVTNLVGGDWQGAASGKFNELFDQWNVSAADLQRALSGISQLLGNAASAYAETESQIAQSMNQG
ncbi:MAG TPA: WXG100 family type VII secretion target [Mycobacteriales bacterium]|nr:WXG100 family type VII secretion target [Mycobacteriales bacterium]